MLFQRKAEIPMSVGVRQHFMVIGPQICSKRISCLEGV